VAANAAVTANLTVVAEGGGRRWRTGPWIESAAATRWAALPSDWLTLLDLPYRASLLSISGRFKLRPCLVMGIKFSPGLNISL
jgi:hypothetical protein